MADYVSILRRTLDGLGSGATPALRERVYGRARDAVRRQLDGMVPPPAEDVKARQLDQLEAAVAEVEAGYADAVPADAPVDAPVDAPADAPGGAPPSAGTPPSAAAAPASDTTLDPDPDPEDAAPPAAPPAPSNGAIEDRDDRDRDGSDARADGTGDPSGNATVEANDPGTLGEPPARPATVSISGRLSDIRPRRDEGPEPGAGTGRDVPPGRPATGDAPSFEDAPRADAASGDASSGDLSSGDALGAGAAPAGASAAPAPTAPLPAAPLPAPLPAAPLPPVDDLPPPSYGPAPDPRSGEAGPEVLDADGPVGGRLPDEELPSVAMIGPNGDAVLDPAEAVRLGASGVAAAFDDPRGAHGAAGAIAPLDPSPVDVPPPVDVAPGDTFGVDTGVDDAAPDGPPASTLAAAPLPRPEPLQPEPLQPELLRPEPLDGIDPADRVPDASAGMGAGVGAGAGAGAGAGMGAGAGAFGGATSALAFANRGRPDLPGGTRAPEPGDDAAAPYEPTAYEPGTYEPGAYEPGAYAPPRAGDEDVAVAMPRADGPADPFPAAHPTPPPTTTPAAPPSAVDEPIVVAPPAYAEPSVHAEPSAHAEPSPDPAPADAAAPLSASAKRDGPPDIAVPPPERRGRGGMWAGLLAALLIVLGGLLLGRAPLADATGVEGFRTAFGLGPAVDRAVDGVRGALLGDAGTDVAAPVDPPLDDPADAPDPGTGVVTVEPTPVPPAENTAVAGTGTKLPDRLPTAGGEGAIDVTPGDGDVTVTSVPVETVTPDAPPAQGTGEGTGEGTEEVAVLRPDDPTNAPAADPATPPPGAGRAFLVGEPVAGVSDRADGAVTWSVAQESPGRDLPPEPAIRGDITLQDGSAVEITVRRNADESLPASHLIEIVFALPDGGRTVNRLPLVGFKDSLQVPARPLVAVPAKITDDFFVVGLNSLASAVESNLALMGSEQFMDVQLIDGNDRRATLTLEKGEDGTAVFGEVLDAWNDAPLPG